MKKLFALLFTIALAASLVACGSVNITAVNLSAHKLLNKGDTIQLTPAFASEKEKNREKVAAAAEALTLEWATSNESVATVDGTGLVTAVGAGEADITVTIAETEISAVCSVTVEVKAEGVAAPETLDFTVGDEGKNLDAKIIPEDATNVTLQYESSDETIATVDETGVVTPVSAGKCVIKTNITASAQADAAQTENLASAETNVTVKAAVKPAAASAPSHSSSSPAPNPAPAPVQKEEPKSDPAPAPAPVPAPEPEPAPGGNINEGTGRDNNIIEGGGSFENSGDDSTQAPGRG